MSIPPRFLDEIRNRLTLSDVIGKSVRVIRTGREFKACCPFHHEKTPSFTINDDKQFYHCFGCGAHGDVIGFVMRHNGLSFIEAVEMLSAEAGLQMPKPDPMAVEKSRKEKDLHALMDTAARWFQSQLDLSSNKDVLEYLRNRGLGDEARALFRIGYAPADGQALRLFLKSEGFTDAQMLEAGVIKDSAKGGQPYAFFRDRVMFPVGDKRGRVVAFGGRVLPEHLRPITSDGFKPPKYINSGDTPLFDKGRTLYAESYARHAVREGHTLIVTEGYMDVIACHMAGFKATVAPMGTALTEEQILSLWSMMGEGGKTPIVCFDGDNAGRRAASRVVERIMPLLKPDRSIRFAFLSEGEDPDSLLKAGGRQGLQAILAASLSLFDFLWASHTAGRSFDTPEARAGLQKTLQSEIGKIVDPEIQKHYRELLRSRISQAFFTAYEGKSKSRAANGSGPQRPSALKLRVPQKAPQRSAEKILLATVLNNPEIYAPLEEELGSFTIASTRLSQLRQKIIEIFQTTEGLEANSLRAILLAEGYEKEMDDIQNESVYVHAAFSRPGSAKALGQSEMIHRWQSMKEGLADAAQAVEVKLGWHSAFENTNQDAENRVIELLRLKSSEEGRS
jgi:DNA primase